MLVALSHVKKWATLIDHDQELLEDPEDFSSKDHVDDEVPQDDMSENSDDVQDITMEDAHPELKNESPSKTSQNMSEDGLPPGYYNVEAILNHKCQQRWNFFNKWDGYPLNSSTWEPPRAFKLGKRLWNEIFLQCCKQKGLQVSDKGSIKEKDSGPFHRDPPLSFCQKLPTKSNVQNFSSIDSLDQDAESSGTGSHRPKCSS